MKKDVVKILFLLVILAGFSLNRAYAIGGDFSIELSPAHPAPGARTTARIVSYSFEVDRSDIVWRVDGKIAAEGAGEKSFEFTAPAAGKEIELGVGVVTEKGEKAFKSLKIVGNDVDLLWSALTSVPSWYKGRALPVVQSSVRIVAIPHLFSAGAEISSSELVYEWFLNFEKDLAASGRSKNYFTFAIKDYDDTTVSLKVSSRDRKVVFEKGTVFIIDNIEPKVVFYEENLLEGPRYNMAFSERIKIDKDEIIVKAEPYFFSGGDVSNFSYQWTMNGEGIEQDGLQNLLAFKRSGESGASSIGFEMSSLLQELQSAEGIFEIEY